MLDHLCTSDQFAVWFIGIIIITLLGVVHIVESED